MLLSRKKFIQQSAFAVAGTCISSNLFAGKSSKQPKKVLDDYHPADCSIDLATQYKYTYSEDPATSQIKVLNGYYSYPHAASGNMVNPFNNDVVYDLEGAPPDNSCPQPSNGCANTDVENKNPFRYTVYYPRTDIHDYAAKPLPAFALFHAGGFMECTNNDGGNIKSLCIELSQKGYICFSVEYRRGRIIDWTNFPNPLKVSVQQQMARYRGIQDGCGFIRTMMKKNQPTDPEKFEFVIDEDQVFIGGASAGGVIALGCAYYRTQAMIDSVFPKDPASTYSIKQVLGDMHTDLYYAPPDPQYWPKFAGVASLWGGFVVPQSYDGNETAFFTQGNPGIYDNPPLICFHGNLDVVIPLDDGNVPGVEDQDIDLSPYNALAPDDYKSENLCTINNRTFSQKTDTGPELKMCSSLNLFLVMRQLNRFSEFYLDCSMAHGLDNDCISCTYASTFGTSATDQATTVKYIAERIAIFSQPIMTSFPNVVTFGAKGRNYFKDCENFRKCNQMNNHACGNGNTLCNDTNLF